MWIVLLVAVVVIVAVVVWFSVVGARRRRLLAGLDDPDAPRTTVVDGHEVDVATARASRPDGGPGFMGGPGA